MGQQFPRSERLRSRKEIESLFRINKSFSESGIRCVWSKVKAEDVGGVKAAFSVPKRQYKKAVDRNLLKRRMREAYRLNKADLIQWSVVNELNVNLMFIYTAPQVTSYALIEEKIILILRRLILLNE